MVFNFILLQIFLGVKVFVVVMDIFWFLIVEGGDVLSEDWFYVELSVGVGVVVLLIGENLIVFQVDVGVNGYYGYEVMDICCLIFDSEVGDVDLLLMFYFDCCEQIFCEYKNCVLDVDYKEMFYYFVFYILFGGMVKGVYWMMMCKFVKVKNVEIEQDF